MSKEIVELAVKAHADGEKAFEKSNKSAAIRYRKTLSEIAKRCKEQRAKASVIINGAKL